MDQYSAGNIDMLSRLKQVQDRINNLPTVIKKTAEEQQQKTNEIISENVNNNNKKPTNSISSQKSSGSGRNTIFDVIKQATAAEKQKQQKIKEQQKIEEEQKVDNIVTSKSNNINPATVNTNYKQNIDSERMARLESRLDRFELLLERLVDKMDTQFPQKNIQSDNNNTDKPNKFNKTTTATTLITTTDDNNINLNSNQGEHNQVLSASSATTATWLKLKGIV